MRPKFLPERLDCGSFVAVMCFIVYDSAFQDAGELTEARNARLVLSVYG